MRGVLAVGAAVVAVLVPAGPAVTVTADPATPHPRPQVLPGVPDPPAEWCTVPIGAVLEPCRPDGRLQPPVACVLPVDLPPGTTLVTPGCPPPDRSPEGRVVPLTR